MSESAVGIGCGVIFGAMMAHFFESLEVQSRIIVLIVVFFATLSIFYNARAFAVRTELFEGAVKRVKIAHRANNRVINDSN
jgi:hypothetical protein